MLCENRTALKLHRLSVILFYAKIVLVAIAGVFLINIAIGRMYIPSIIDGQVYTITLPYVLPDSLHHFTKQGNTITLYSNCVQLSGCSFWGFWTLPFQLIQNSDGSYTTIFTTSTVINEYRFVPVDGGVDVFARHDQCYPIGCQNPPMQYVGQFT